MTIENHVTNFDLSKKLYDLGIKRSTLFYWTIGGVVYRGEMPFWTDSNYSAFLVSELGNFIPAMYTNFSHYCNYSIRYGKLQNDKFFISINSPHMQEKIIDDLISDNEADCRAKMLIYLIENGLVKIEDFK